MYVSAETYDDGVTRRLLLVLLLGSTVACASVAREDEAPTTTFGPAPTAATSSTVPASTTTTATTVPKEFISGKVVDGRGEPIAGALVSSGAVSETTDSSGWFRLVADEPADIEVAKRGWETAVSPWDKSEIVLEVPLRQEKVRGLRVGAGAAGDDLLFQRLLDLADRTAVNALVFDTKQEGGEVVYDSQVVEAHQIGAVVPWYDPRARIEQARAHGLHTITRIVVFEDSFLAEARPDEKLAGPWIDPRSESAWDYNIDLAKEACEIGFDEVQFDYVRFPAGRTAALTGQLDLSQEERVAAIEGFLARARSVLRPMGCRMSADIFAIVVSVANDQGLGQRPEELSRQLEAISPMVYPSHYSDGWLGFPDPNDYPYEVTADAIDAALPRVDQGVQLRPWLQAFWWSNAQIRESIKAAEDRDVGWILWNVGSDFDAAAIPTDEEVAP